MDGSYTTYIEDRMLNLFYEFSDLESGDTYEDIIEFLKGEEFRSFGDGLVDLIKQKDKEADLTVDESKIGSGKKLENELGKKLKIYLEEKCKENDVDFGDIVSRNTCNNWFGKTRPRKEIKNRERMFALAFALKLDIEETKYLFHKVYFDRAFDYRNYREAVYYYCIAKGYKYERANKIINVIEEREDKTSIEKRHSLSIAKEIGKVETDAELIDWICDRWSEFQFNNKTAIENFKILFGKVQELAQEEYSIDMELKEKKEEKKEEKSKIKKKREKINIHKESDKFVYYVLFEKYPEPNEEHAYISIIKKGTNIHKELKNIFPQTNDISYFYRKTDSEFKSKEYEKFRKIIIVFYFYWFFRNVKKTIQLSNWDYRVEFLTEINELLNECGMCELYPANPYDILFLFCAETYYPIDTLRNIMTKLRGEENE